MKLPRFLRLLPSVVLVGAALLAAKTTGLVHAAYADAQQKVSALTDTDLRQAAKIFVSPDGHTVRYLFQTKLSPFGTRAMDQVQQVIAVARDAQPNTELADAKISVHGDGSYTAGARGFHVIAPTDRRPWTHDIYHSSKRLAVDTRAALKGKGIPVANYIAGGDGLDFRSDLGTLNLSDVPTVMVELGNMLNRRDAHRMTTAKGRATYARALARGAASFLG